MAEVLELHDRQRVQVYGLDYSNIAPTAMRLRAFDHHEPLHALSDAQAARSIRELEIDLLIDLTGLTAGSRYGVMGYRPAPVQASYLDYMGSSAIPGVDFILADHFLIPPELWARWMRILQRSPGSVLWVLQDHPQARENLTAHAKSQGIAIERLVFATRVAPEFYLARYHCADLFLHTSPYGAGTTASDALWVGLPVLTHPGASMVSRMAGS